MQFYAFRGMMVDVFFSKSQVVLGHWLVQDWPTSWAAAAAAAAFLQPVTPPQGK